MLAIFIAGGWHLIRSLEYIVNCFLIASSLQGKWMYEILLGSKGIMQLGWATLICRFTNEVSRKNDMGRKKIKINKFKIKLEPGQWLF